MIANSSKKKKGLRRHLGQSKKNAEVIGYVGLAAILAFTVVFSAVYFIGPSSEGDDWYYSAIGYALSAGYSPYTALPGYTLPPLLLSRFMVNVPIAFFDYIFGPGPVQSAMWNVLAYLLTVSITFFLAKEMYDYKVGLLAAALVALSPVVVTYATTVDDDTIMMFMTALMALAFLLGIRYKSGKWLFTAGTVAVLSVFATPQSIEFIVFLLLCTVFLASCKKISLKEVGFAVAGIALGIVIVLIAGYFLSGSGNPLWEFQSLYGYAQTAGAPSEFLEFGYYLPYMFPYKIVAMLQSGSLSTLSQITYFISTYDYNINQAGLYFYAVIPVSLYLLLRKEKSSYFFIAWIIFILAYLTIGPNTISLNLLSYSTPPKLPRYLMLLAVPTAILLAMGAVSFVKSARSRTRKIVWGAIAGLVVLALLENAFVVDVYNYLSNEYQLYSNAPIANYLQALPNNTPIYYQSGFPDTPMIYMHFDNLSRFYLYGANGSFCVAAPNGSYAILNSGPYPVFNGTGWVLNSNYTWVDFVNNNCSNWQLVLDPIIGNLSTYGIPLPMQQTFLPQSFVNLKLYYKK